MEETNTKDNTGNGNKPTGFSAIDRAEQVAKRMEDSEKRLDEKISKLQELEANRLLGSTAGGRIEPEPVKEKTAKEYADEVMSGKIKAQ